MLSIDDFQAAGDRAAAQPVAPGPSISTLELEVSRRRGHRRLVAVSGVGIVAILAAASVAMLAAVNEPAQIVTAGGQQANAEPTSDDSPSVRAAEPTVDPVVGDDSDRTSAGALVIEGLAAGDGTTELEVSGHLLLGGDVKIEIRTIQGDGSAEAAEAAAAAADETRQDGDLEIWIERNGDRLTASALVEPDKFVAVTGSAEVLDDLIEMITGDGFEFGPWPGIGGLGQLPDFDQLLPEELFRRLEDGQWWLGGDDFDELAPFGDGVGNLAELDRLLEERLGHLLDGDAPCVRIEFERSADGLQLVLPEGCPSGD